jgi:hypothetical protein
MLRSTHRAARRSAALAGLALVAGLSVLSPSPSSATDGHGSNAASARGRARAVAAHQALDHARAALSGTPATQAPAAVGVADPTMALRDLFVARQDLSGSARLTAHRILARPTSSSDPMGDSYRVPSRKTCSTHVCVHWVPTTVDAPPSRAWVDLTLRTMEAVWKREVDGLGYRKPASDGTRGGNAKLDVYLKDVGAKGYYGYCTTERPVAGHPHFASGYCVLDDDFARSQFGAAPQNSLKVTAAHEFFHAIQFNYDYREDAWFMEATATWMEEQVYDGINDNRQYLPAGQVRHPETPLDTFDDYGSEQYGNWPFFEFLSSRWGRDLVRTAWYDASAVAGAPNQYSIEAVKSVLASHGGLPAVYADFAGANTRPAEVYQEGASWPTAAIARTWTLTSSAPAQTTTQTVDHLAAKNVRAIPGNGLGAGDWMLGVAVDGPNRGTSPAVLVTIDRTGDLSTLTQRVALDSTGAGTADVPFSRAQVAKVTVSLANASTRYACHDYTDYSCHGTPTDDDQPFRATLTAHQP